MHAETKPLEAADQGVDRKALRLIRQRFQQVNDARLARTRLALDSRQQLLLDVLPLLFHVNHPMLPGYVSHRTPHGVASYTPSKADLARGMQLARSFTWKRNPHAEAAIDSLFLMGSTGTVAQSDSSDLDIWVCHVPELDSQQLALLRQRCDAITAWAATLGQEVHFFLMEGKKFQLGQREGASGEDCGSSQHFLLLDEFYRTGLLLAGKPPIWWLVPPDAEQHYHEVAELLRSKRFIPRNETIDFGGIGHIPAGEFVGAGIWQLYKAIDSPYKSVIKLLLTELYARDYPQAEPLSLSYKRAIYAKAVDLDELDPYVMMYRRLERYLLQRGELDRLELVRRGFYFKVGKSLTRAPTGRTRSWQRQLLERMVAEWGWRRVQLQALDARPHWSVPRVQAEQKEVARELTNGYRFLQDFARRTQADALINSRDMTVLGRKLYAAFERRAGKVEWVNPGIAPVKAQPVLTFTQLAGGRENQFTWAVLPQHWNGQEAPSTQPLRRGKDLISVLTWCHVNGILDESTRLRVTLNPAAAADPALRPEVSEAELQQIARSLLESLPVHRGDWLADAEHPDRFLSPNRPVVVKLFINVGVDPLAEMRSRGLERLSSQTDSLGYSGLRENLVLAVDQITVTSWGEVSTRSYVGPFALIQCLRDYLAALPPERHPGLPQLQIHCHCPTRASAIAARVRQLFDEIIACYYSGQRPPSTRYVLEIQREFYVLQWLDGQPTVQRATSQKALLEQLGRLQRQYSPIVLDRYCLPDSALAAIVQQARAGAIQIFYQRRDLTAEVSVLDEMGSLYRFTTPFRDEQTLLQPLNQFIQSTLFRRRSESADFAGGTHEVVLQESDREIEYYELVTQNGRTHAEARALAPTASNFFNVQAIADYDHQGQLIFTIYCDQTEFAELELGEALYDTVARSILARRHSRERYPCYLTDIDLSRRVSEPTIQTAHYLRYKQRLEQALNEALQRVE
ncbi:MAG: class I adenylate cyclase [Spongiibacteraceae bacterium]|jgi:adenylate cyclase class 1|nr:class I adenylate cyclase [Spongiibacteraceae bacterium]